MFTSILIIIILISAPISTHTPSAEHYLDRHVNVVYVQPNGETYTLEEKRETNQAVKDAFSFWSKANLTIPEIDTSELYIDKNPYITVINEWCSCQFTSTVTDTLTIYVIDNSESNLLLFNQYAGYAQAEFSFIVVVLDSSPVELAAQIAHELGHIYYSLPDFYKIPGKCVQDDIMCYPQSAYSRKFIGCLTLDYIGITCTRTYLPLVIK